MRHPLERIATSRRRVAFVWLLSTTAALTIVLLLVDRMFEPGIIGFELAREGDRALSMVQGWDSTARAFVGFSLGLDYLYLCAYSTTLALACVMLGTALRDRGAHRVAGLSSWVAWMQWLAAAFDALENATLLDTLTRDGYPGFAPLSWAFACAKFGLLAIGVVYLVGGACLALSRRRMPPASDAS